MKRKAGSGNYWYLKCDSKTNNVRSSTLPRKVTADRLGPKDHRSVFTREKQKNKAELGAAASLSISVGSAVPGSNENTSR